MHRTRRARGRLVVRVVLREPGNARWARWPARRRLQRPGDRRPAGVRPADPVRAPRRLERRALRGRGAGRSSSCGGAFARLAVQPRRGRARARKRAVARVAAAAGRRAAGSSRGVRPAADAGARTRRDRLCRLRGRGSGRGLERDLRARQSRRGRWRRRRGGRGVRGCDGGGALHRRPGDVALRPGPPRRGGRRCRGERLRTGRRGAAPGSGVRRVRARRPRPGGGRARRIQRFRHTGRARQGGDAQLRRRDRRPGGDRARSRGRRPAGARS